MLSEKTSRTGAHQIGVHHRKSHTNQVSPRQTRETGPLKSTSCPARSLRLGNCLHPTESRQEMFRSLCRNICRICKEHLAGTTPPCPYPAAISDLPFSQTQSCWPRLYGIGNNDTCPLRRVRVSVETWLFRNNNYPESPRMPPSRKFQRNITRTSDAEQCWNCLQSC